MEIKLQIGVISRDNSEYCHYAIPENRAQDREKPRKISRIRAWGERGGLAHPKHRLSTRNPSPRAGASGNETRVASVRNPKSRIQNHVSALRRSELGQGHGQAIGARMHGSAPWKTEETIVGLPRLLVLSVLSRSDSPDLVAVFHPPHPPTHRGTKKNQKPSLTPPPNKKNQKPSLTPPPKQDPHLAQANVPGQSFSRHATIT